MLLSAALLLTGSGEPAERKPAFRADVRCFLVTGAMLQAQDRAIAEAGLLGAMYWFGRVDQHLSDRALEEMLAAESLSMTAADIQLEAQRCGAEMEVRGRR